MWLKVYCFETLYHPSQVAIPYFVRHYFKLSTLKIYLAFRYSDIIFINITKHIGYISNLEKLQ